MARNHRLLYDELMAARRDAEPWIVDHQPIAVAVQDDEIAPSAIADAAARAATLLESEGVGVGDRCVLWLDSVVDVLVLISGLSAVGAVPILISPTLDAETVGEMLAPTTGVDRVITTTARVAQYAAVGDGRRVDDWSVLTERMATMSPRTAPAVELPDTAPYVVTHTSGTTGVPKLVEYTRAVIDYHGHLRALGHRVFRMKGYAVFALSPSHGATVVALLFSLRRNSPLILLAATDPATVSRIVQQRRPTFLETVPNTYMLWEDLADAGVFRSVRWFYATFDVLHPATVQRFLRGSGRKFALFFELYGQSELGAISARTHLKGIGGGSKQHELGRRMKGHPVGRGVPGVTKIRIVDADGAQVPAGTPGRIQVRTKALFSTYINRPEAARAGRSEGGWWDTGDWGEKDRFGRLTLIDRQVDRVSTVPSSIAVEDLLLERMPWLLEIVVLEQHGRIVPVAAVREGGFDADAWREAVVDLPGFDSPVVVDFASLPKTATGKIRRSVLAARIAEGSGSPASPK
ncbi:class I adenylate-forming enzyme family protein [Streptomyces sp. NPDC002187]|uniref:class I adenylate-forming enzyme family protein n=1 Tax=Streptomyces sp. NPDC002187 TaxID=3364637 RepID=UPI0036CABA20